jgi:TatD DNase family protein
MFDTHAHLFDNKLLDNNIDFLLEKINKLNFIGIICICETEQEINFFLNYYKKYNFLYCSIGIHPHNAKEFSLQKLTSLFNKVYPTGRLVAIGETGLDFYYNFSSAEQQVNCFLSHIEFAKKCSLPLIIHSRNSNQKIVEILKYNNVEHGVIHCFSGDYIFAKSVLDLGLYLGFTGIVTFKNNKNYEELILKLPEDKIVIETDSPYLSPEPFRGKINTPLNLVYILEKISKFRNSDLEDLEKIMDTNSLKLFNSIKL